MKRIILVLVLLMSSMNLVLAASAGGGLEDLKYNSIVRNAPNPKDVPVLDAYIMQGIKFVYLGEKNSVDNWLSVKEDSLQLLSTTIDGKAMIVGPIYDGEGNNVVLSSVKEAFPTMGESLYLHSQKALSNSIDLEMGYLKEKTKAALKEKTKAPVMDSDELTNFIWTTLENTFYIEKGNPSAPVIYIFSDIFCGHCNELSEKLNKYINTSEIRVRYIPVGILSEGSVKGAMGILSSVDAVAAWTDYYDNGNIDILSTIPTEQGLDRLEKNLVAFDELKLRGTPSLFYKTKDGEVKFLYGQPGSMEEFINDITG
jgi:thiol:disulfide interchange protein DsbG